MATFLSSGGMSGVLVGRLDRGLAAFSSALQSRDVGAILARSELYYVGLLPALERPLDQATASLERLLEHQPGWKPEDVCLEQLVLTGLGSPSAYWFEAAVGWLSQGFHVDRDIAEIVHRRRDERGLSQAARHRAFTLVRQWERSQDNGNLEVRFDVPEHGWLGITLRSGDKVYTAHFSHIYPSLEQLCLALCDVAEGVPGRRVVLLLEPQEDELSFEPSGSLTVLRAVRFRDRRRQDGVGETQFEHTGHSDQVVLRFWRALRHLQATLPTEEFRERWRNPFPGNEMAALTVTAERLKSARPAATDD